MKKIIVSGVLAGAVMLICGLIVGQLFQVADPSIGSEYRNPTLFRPWSDPIMSLFFVQPFVAGIILALIWSKVRVVWGADIRWQNGISFGFAYWLVGIPGMIISYGTFPLSFMMVLSWTTGGLVGSLCAGFLFSKMLR